MSYYEGAYVLGRVGVPVDEQIPATLPQARLTSACDISGLKNFTALE